MKQSGHLNPSEETGTGCPVTSVWKDTSKQAWRCGSTTTTTTTTKFYIKQMWTENC